MLSNDPTERRLLLYAVRLKLSHWYDVFSITYSTSDSNKGVRRSRFNVNEYDIFHLLNHTNPEFQEGKRGFYEELKRWGIDTNEYNVPIDKLPPEYKPVPRI